jgi:ParB family chromosome partitioning protein
LLIEKNEISQGHAKVLVGLDNAHFLARKIIEKKLSVRQAENLVRSLKSYKGKNKIIKNPNLTNLESSIEEKTGIKVFIRNKKNNAGQITFEYKDLDQLNRLIMVIKENY